MKINRKIQEGKWFDFNEKVRVLIRPFPTSFGLFRPETPMELAEATWIRFNYSLLDWEGIEDEDGSKLEVTENNKKFLYDYFEDLMVFVTLRIRDMTSEVNQELKN